MTAPMASDTTAKLDPLGPDPKTMGNGPMKMAPPVEVPACANEPTMITPKPSRSINEPASSSLRNGYTRLSTRVNTIRIIASTIAKLAHFMSDPNMIGTGPIITTPPPLTLLPSFLPSDSIEMTTTPNPTKTSKKPARTKSTIERKPGNLDKGFCWGGIAERA